MNFTSRRLPEACAIISIPFSCHRVLMKPKHSEKSANTYQWKNTSGKATLSGIVWE
jgi:hypothetical protein